MAVGTAVAGFAAFAACARGGEEDGSVVATPTREDSSAGIIVPSARPYSVVPLNLTARVSGSIEIVGAGDGVDSAVSGGTNGVAGTDGGNRANGANGANGSDSSGGMAADECPVPVSRSATAASAKNGGEPVVVWVDGVTEGKPLPMERRYRLTSEGCGLEPRVQPVVVGSTINVHNRDRTLHTLYFVRQGTADTVATVPFTHSGQLVPVDRIAQRAGIIEVHCKEHPTSRAYIAVFDHPYFAMASSGKVFTIDSLPPGEHAVRSWFVGAPRPAEQRVSLSGGEEGTVTFQADR